jgi:hypothetical protein
MKYAIEMGSGDMIYTYLPSFMKIGRDIPAILRFCLGNLKGSNIGITRWEGFIKYAIEIDSDGMIYVCTQFHDDQFRN